MLRIVHFALGIVAGLFAVAFIGFGAAAHQFLDPDRSFDDTLTTLLTPSRRPSDFVSDSLFGLECYPLILNRTYKIFVGDDLADISIAGQSVQSGYRHKLLERTGANWSSPVRARSFQPFVPVSKMLGPARAS